MNLLIGYINVFKRKTGFCIPVYLDEMENFVVQDDFSLIRPEPKLLKKENYFYKFDVPEKINIDLKIDKHSLFVYNFGRSYINIFKGNSEIITNISQDSLTEIELTELNYVLEKRRLINSYTNFRRIIKNKVSKLDIHQLINIVDTSDYSLRVFDIDPYELFCENKEFIMELSDDFGYCNKVIYCFIYFLNFQELSVSEIESIFYDININDNEIRQKKLFQQLYYLTIKNSNNTYLSKLLILDFRTNRNDLIIRKVFKEFGKLKKLDNRNIDYHIAFFLSVLSDLARFNNVENNNNLSKEIESGIIELMENISNDVFQSEILIMENKILPLFLREGPALLNFYISNKEEYAQYSVK